LLLVCLLVAAQASGVRPQYDLANYLAVATAYRSPNRALARREIREWRSGEIEAALRALREEGDRLRGERGQERPVPAEQAEQDDRHGEVDHVVDRREGGGEERRQEDDLQHVRGDRHGPRRADIGGGEVIAHGRSHSRARGARVSRAAPCVLTFGASRVPTLRRGDET